jgi:hypothetical protein
MRKGMNKQVQLKHEAESETTTTKNESWRPNKPLMRCALQVVGANKKIRFARRTHALLYVIPHVIFFCFSLMKKRAKKKRGAAPRYTKQSQMMKKNKFFPLILLRLGSLFDLPCLKQGKSVEHRNRAFAVH